MIGGFLEGYTARSCICCCEVFALDARVEFRLDVAKVQRSCDRCVMLMIRIRCTPIFLYSKGEYTIRIGLCVRLTVDTVIFEKSQMVLKFAYTAQGSQQVRRTRGREGFSKIKLSYPINYQLCLGHP